LSAERGRAVAVEVSAFIEQGADSVEAATQRSGPSFDAPTQIVVVPFEPGMALRPAHVRLAVRAGLARMCAKLPAQPFDLGVVLAPVALLPRPRLP
jgi:hypothetical protein